MMLPSSSLYEETNQRYYIEAQTKLEPACRVLPSSAAEVAKIVSIATEKQCHFAVASGKHWVISGGSNIGPDGFTIDLMFLNGTSLSKDHSIASIGPGLRAGAVYDFLDQYGLYVAVGRGEHRAHDVAFEILMLIQIETLECKHVPSAGCFCFSI